MSRSHQKTWIARRSYGKLDKKTQLNFYIQKRKRHWTTRLGTDMVPSRIKVDHSRTCKKHIQEYCTVEHQYQNHGTNPSPHKAFTMPHRKKKDYERKGRWPLELC